MAITVGYAVETPDGPQLALVDLASIRRHARSDRVEDLLEDMTLICDDVTADRTVSTIIAEQPSSRRWHPTWDDYNADSASNDSLVSDLEVRIIALEEAVASRRARRRLARSIRRADKAYRWAGSFFAARLESTTCEWQNGPRWLAEVRKGAC